MRFQESKGLVADGIVGPVTLGAMFGPVAPAVSPTFDSTPWFEEAMRLMGLKENKGKGKSNQAIEDLAKTVKIAYGDDGIPWCGLFVGHCVAAALPSEPVPTALLMARSWERFGDPCTPQRGAVMVFWRESKTSGLGHVGFNAGEDKAMYHILGGNQSDMVSVAGVPKNRFLTARWPRTGLAPAGSALFADAALVSVSTKED